MKDKSGVDKKTQKDKWKRIFLFTVTNLSEDDAIEKAVNDLEKSLLNELSRDAKIVDKLVDKEMKDEENMLINVVFVVYQNIVSEDTVRY